jgi:hypothetical protein
MCRARPFFFGICDQKQEQAQAHVSAHHFDPGMKLKSGTRRRWPGNIEKFRYVRT